MKRILAFLLTLGLLQAFTLSAEARHDHEDDKDKGERSEKKAPAPKPVRQVQPQQHHQLKVPQNNAAGGGQRENKSSRHGNRNSQTIQSQNNSRNADVKGDNNPGRGRDRNNRNRDNGSVQMNQSKDGSKNADVKGDNNPGRGRDRNDRRDFSNNRNRDNGSVNNSGDIRNDRRNQVRRDVTIHRDLQKMGIKHVPEPIRDRNAILRVDRHRSVISYPKEGPKGRQLNNFVIAKNVNALNVRNQMSLVVKSRTFSNQITVFNRSENRPNQYYWHHYGGFDYCHYYDPWGYHWYGWYAGSNYFWTRYYSNRWWWYDSSYDRWCYWNNGGWWWQDPYRVNVVYIYNNNRYVPANNDLSSSDQESVQVFRNSDQTRTVRIVGENRDAFLSDTSDYPSFKPVYLDSDVKDVKFSDGGQIMLTLKSGSFELFDADGYPYNKSGQSISSNQNSSLSLDGSQEVPPVPKDTSSDKLPPIPGH